MLPYTNFFKLFFCLFVFPVGHLVWWTLDSCVILPPNTSSSPVQFLLITPTRSASLIQAQLWKPRIQVKAITNKAVLRLLTFMYVYVCMHLSTYLIYVFIVMGRAMHVGIRRQLVGISSPLPPCVFQDWTQKAPLPTVPPCQVPPCD